MRLRLIAFLPAAALVAGLLLVTTSSFVSAVERSWSAEPPPAPAPIRIRRYETECEGLRREIDQLIEASTSCDRELACLGSPLLCPITMTSKTEERYEALRETLADRCETPPIGRDGDRSTRLPGMHEAAFDDGSIGRATTDKRCAATEAWRDSEVDDPSGPGQFFF